MAGYQVQNKKDRERCLPFFSIVPCIICSLIVCPLYLGSMVSVRGQGKKSQIDEITNGQRLIKGGRKWKVENQRLKIIKVKSPLADLRIDYMQESDLPAVMEIERQSFTSPWSETSFRQGLKQSKPPVHFLVARHHQNPVAYINFWVVQDEAHIANFAVSPNYRNRGVGKYLFAKSLACIRKLAGRDVLLEVRVSNISAQNLYRQFGFKIASIRKNYYADNREDAYIFWLSDLATIDLRIDEE